MTSQVRFINNYTNLWYTQLQTVSESFDPICRPFYSHYHWNTPPCLSYFRFYESSFSFMILLFRYWLLPSLRPCPPTTRVKHRQLVLGEDKHNSDAPLCWLSRWHTLLHLNFLNHSFSVKWTTFAFISLVKLPSDIVQHSPLSRTMTEFFAFPQKSQMNHWFNGRNSWHAQLSYKNSNMTHHFKRLEGSSDEVLVAIS